MQLSKTQKIYLALGVIAVAAFVVDRVFLRSGSGGPAPARAAADTPGPAAARPPAMPAPAPPVAVPPSDRPSLAARLDALAKDPGVDVGGMRDAFVPPPSWIAEVKSPEPEVVEPSAAEKFAAAHTLTAVLLAGKGGCAVVNGKVVQVGQEVDGFELVSLARECAVFQGGQERVELRLHLEGGARHPQE